MPSTVVGAAGLIDPYFRGINIQSCHSGGQNGNDRYDTNRPSNNTKSLYSQNRTKNVGHRGDDFICGHCGHVMLENFDPSTVTGNPVYQCEICENNNDLPFAASNRRYWSSR
jgi:hypothetical protein